MPNPFSLKRSSQGNLSVIHLEGYLDAHTAPQFEQAVQEEIDAGRYRIVVDCASLTYISSSTLR